VIVRNPQLFGALVKAPGAASPSLKKAVSEIAKKEEKPVQEVAK